MTAIDQDLLNDDWLRSRTWDILPADLKTLLRVLDVQDAQRGAQAGALREFLKLPAAIPAPDSIKQEAEALLGVKVSEWPSKP